MDSKHDYKVGERTSRRPLSIPLNGFKDVITYTPKGSTRPFTFNSIEWIQKESLGLGGYISS